MVDIRRGLLFLQQNLTTPTFFAHKSLPQQLRVGDVVGGDSYGQNSPQDIAVLLLQTNNNPPPRAPSNRCSPQSLFNSPQGSVESLLQTKIRDAYNHPAFQTDVAKPMLIDRIKDQEVQHLSGGEMQRVAITLALGKPADLYLIDEPSAYLDVEQRIVAAKVIKR